MKTETAIVSAMAAIMLFVIGTVSYYFKSEVVDHKLVEVELVAISNKPKHFHVDIRDISTGIVHKHVYVSKHYNDWEDLPFNVPFVVNRVTRKYVNRGDKIEVEFDELRSGLDWSKQFKVEKPWPFKH